MKIKLTKKLRESGLSFLTLIFILASMGGIYATIAKIFLLMFKNPFWR